MFIVEGNIGTGKTTIFTSNSRKIAAPIGTT